MTTNTQIGQDAFLYVNDLQVSWASNTTLTIAAGQCRDSSNNMDILLGNYLSQTDSSSGSTTTTLNAATVGPNGLDTGVLANNTWYAVFVIGSSLNEGQPATLLSTSATSPIMPLGYDAIRRIGWVRTNGSAQFILFYTDGNGNERIYSWDSVITVKASGAGNSNFQALSLTAAMPSTSKHVHIQSSLIANTAGNVVNFRPTGSSSSANIGTNSPVTTTATLNMINAITNSGQSIDWKTSEGTDTLALWVAGFTDFI